MVHARQAPFRLTALGAPDGRPADSDRSVAGARMIAKPQLRLPGVRTCGHVDRQPVASRAGIEVGLERCAEVLDAAASLWKREDLCVGSRCAAHRFRSWA